MNGYLIIGCGWTPIKWSHFHLDGPNLIRMAPATCLSHCVELLSGRRRGEPGDRFEQSVFTSSLKFAKIVFKPAPAVCQIEAVYTRALWERDSGVWPIDKEHSVFNKVVRRLQVWWGLGMEKFVHLWALVPAWPRGWLPPWETLGQVSGAHGPSRPGRGQKPRGQSRVWEGPILGAAALGCRRRLLRGSRESWSQQSEGPVWPCELQRIQKICVCVKSSEFFFFVCLAITLNRQRKICWFQAQVCPGYCRIKLATFSEDLTIHSVSLTTNCSQTIIEKKWGRDFQRQLTKNWK